MTTSRARCRMRMKSLNRSRSAKPRNSNAASKATAMDGRRLSFADALLFSSMMDWRPAQPCALRSKHCGNAARPKLSWQFRSAPRTRVASLRMKPTKSFVRASQSFSRRSDSITKISRKRATTRCAIYLHALRKEVDPLFRRRFGSRSNPSWPVILEPTSTPFFHLFQPLLLLRGEIRRNLAVRFGNRFADAAAGVAPDFFELRPRFLDDRRNLGHLFVRQTKLPLQTALHRLSGKTVTMRAEEETMGHGRTHEHASGAAGQKHQYKTGDQFPFQRAIHWATSS